MKKYICFSILLIGLLAGCGSEKDANEKNFSVAITKYLEDNPQKNEVGEKIRMCFHMGGSLDINQSSVLEMQNSPESLFNKMEALEKVGLYTKADIEEKYSTMTTKVRRYTLTDEGKKYYSQHTGNICYGKPILDKVIKWDEILKIGELQMTKVNYRYKLDNIPQWANDSNVKSAFPFLKDTVREATTELVLTNNGWEVQ